MGYVLCRSRHWIQPRMHTRSGRAFPRIQGVRLAACSGPLRPCRCVHSFVGASFTYFNAGLPYMVPVATRMAKLHAQCQNRTCLTYLPALPSRKGPSYLQMCLHSGRKRGAIQKMSWPNQLLHYRFIENPPVATYSGSYTGIYLYIWSPPI